MANMPGYCPSCGTIFAASNIVGGGGNARITMIGNVTTCPNPRCGKPARLADGEFNINADDVSLVSGPPLTRAILEQLQDIARQAQAEEITPQEAVHRAAQIDPALGQLMSRFLRLGLSALAFLVPLIALYIQREDSKASAQFYKAALEVLTRQAEAAEKTSKEVERSNRIEPKGEAPAKAKADKKPVTVKGPSKRRHQVNKERRRKLIAERKDFPRGR
ncbi:hypothetical protein DBIPINDM_001407 [Mesorhizobium sp. AR02]|uniref:hypothetical protein n=1 Tax=Mesorhizobium sp. AR02 TaxID=2865837 RepID=UPI00216079C2|nr:hypothetical protein [Mesorhizobium sp. AR02]UVK54927.1 hypothetical protein DBIPINDM_001407 [Mesorhizobium sp. AR02]